MKTKSRSNRSGRVQRGAFTLVELMVVITIMAALMALTASAVLKFIGVQQASNTQSTLDRVQSQLIKAWSKVVEQAKKEPIPPGIMALAGSDVNAAERAKYIYVKLRLRQAFPMNFAEALNVPYNNPELANWTLPTQVPSLPPSLPQLQALPGYASYLASFGITPAIWANSATAPPFPDPRESSICLLMALQRGVSGAGIDPSDLTAGGAAGSMITPSGGSIPYLNDAWGRPILFSRAPAGSLNLNPVSAAGNNDPGDPQGYLRTPAWRYMNPATLMPPFTAQYAQYTQLTLEIPALRDFSFKLAPMIASGGPTNWTKTWPPPNWYWLPVPALGLPGPVLPPPMAPALTFDPITFAPCYYTYLPAAPWVKPTPSSDSDALFSTP